MTLQEAVDNKAKLDFVLVKTFYPSEDVYLTILAYNDYLCSCELYNKNNLSVRGWRIFDKEYILDKCNLKD